LVSGGETPGYGILRVQENFWFFSQPYRPDQRMGLETIFILEPERPYNYDSLCVRFALIVRCPAAAPQTCNLI